MNVAVLNPSANAAPDVERWRREFEGELVAPNYCADEQIVETQYSGLKGLIDMAKEIEALASSEESDEYGTLRPTEYAIQYTMNVLAAAVLECVRQALPRDMEVVFPRGDVTSTANGGLRIEWSTDVAAVNLMVASEAGGPSYIYHEHGNDYGTIDRVTGWHLANYLQKFFVK